ncbi:MAG: glycoside hydrolase family 16 protein, partial [Saprospiraceae bacterium]|nr:glycoside hydrolase family 16 protein [Saprospiraceae bacterium]
MKINDVLYLTIFASLLITSCKNAGNSSEDTTTVETETPYQVVIEAEDFTDASDDYQVIDGDVGYVEMSSKGWLLFDVSVERAGRYQSQVFVSVDNDTSSVWIQDYIGNPDGRTYNITGSIPVMVNADFQQFSVDGSPLNDTIRMMKIHTHGNNLKIDKIVFELIKDHQVTPVTLTQNMDGDEWQLAWSDEFDGDELDTTKWIYDIGNWGWGNNELQYYTEGRTENARLENGVLIIEARKNDMGQEWTSARLTTRGKQSFLYGKIELKARV